MENAIRIIGIDPGLAAHRLGGHRQRRGRGSPSWPAARSSPTTGKAWAPGCGRSSMGLQEVLARLAPAEAAIEQTFVNRDAAATLKLGQARGIALLVPALSGC